MKIVMTNTKDHTRKVVTFNEVCNSYYHGQYNSDGGRRVINYKLISGEVIKDGIHEFKREIG